MPARARVLPSLLVSGQTVVDVILDRCSLEKLAAHYALPLWMTTTDFLEHVATKHNKLGKGGLPNTSAAARLVLVDFNAGKIPFFTKPGKAVDGAGTPAATRDVQAWVKVPCWRRPCACVVVVIAVVVVVVVVVVANLLFVANLCGGGGHPPQFPSFHALGCGWRALCLCYACRQDFVLDDVFRAEEEALLASQPSMVCRPTRAFASRVLSVLTGDWWRVYL
jgi:hypothetical protein